MTQILDAYRTKVSSQIKQHKLCRHTSLKTTKRCSTINWLFRACLSFEVKFAADCLVFRQGRAYV